MESPTGFAVPATIRAARLRFPQRAFKSPPLAADRMTVRALTGYTRHLDVDLTYCIRIAALRDPALTEIDVRPTSFPAEEDYAPAAIADEERERLAALLTRGYGLPLDATQWVRGGKILKGYLTVHGARFREQYEQDTEAAIAQWLPREFRGGQRGRRALPFDPPMTRLVWNAILRHYDMHHRPRVEREQAWFAKSASIEEAITRAALATDERRKRFHHQRRIPRRALETARDELLQHKEEIRNSADFDELVAIITNAVRGIHRTGELYAYDTALRISYHLDLLPTRVYLHAGTRAGARALHLPHDDASIDASDLPLELRHRPAHEVEDILCIYKDHFISE